MGAPSKELWTMLAICVPIMTWQTYVFYGASATNGYYVVAFELMFVGCSSYMVWRYGGIREAVTKVLEVTRVWDKSESKMETRGDGRPSLPTNEIPGTLF